MNSDRTPKTFFTLAVIAPVAAALLAIIGGTMAHGWYTERFSKTVSDTDKLRDMANRLPDIKLSFGNWEGEDVADTKDSLRQFEKAKVSGHLNREYTDKKTHKTVRISLVSSARQHAVKHTPEKCYVGAGFKMLQAASHQVVETDVGTAEFLTSQFRKEAEGQRILWAFSHDGNWTAPSSAYLGLLGSNNWYKLYVTTTDSRNDPSKDLEFSKAFIREFLPEVNRALFPQAASEAPEDGS